MSWLHRIGRRVPIHPLPLTRNSPCLRQAAAHRVCTKCPARRLWLPRSQGASAVRSGSGSRGVRLCCTRDWLGQSGGEYRGRGALDWPNGRPCDGFHLQPSPILSSGTARSFPSQMQPTSGCPRLRTSKAWCVQILSDAPIATVSYIHERVRPRARNADSDRLLSRSTGLGCDPVPYCHSDSPENPGNRRNCYHSQHGKLSLCGVT